MRVQNKQESYSVCYREHPRHTAARECSEETLKIFGQTEDLYEMLGNYQTNNVFKVCRFIIIDHGITPSLSLRWLMKELTT